MPVRFYIGDDLPEEIHTLTLSYTLFKVPAAQAASSMPSLASSQP